MTMPLLVEYQRRVLVDERLKLKHIFSYLSVLVSSHENWHSRVGRLLKPLSGNLVEDLLVMATLFGIAVLLHD